MVPMDGMIEPSINVNEDALTLDVRVRKSALQARHGTTAVSWRSEGTSMVGERLM